MKNRTYIAFTFAALAAACALFGASNAKASVTYTINVNTSTLITNVTGPFALDFQFNGTAGNTATISNFNYGGGASTNSPAGNTTGAAAGSLSGGTILLGATSGVDAFNEFYQGFTPGATFSFDVTLGTAVNPTDAPDQFFFSILDGSLANITTDGLGDSLASITIDPSLTLSSNTGIGGFAGVTTTVVPEPSAAVLGTLGAVALLRRRRRAN